MVIGALEVGGTKMVCAIGDENGIIKEQISIPTVSPEKTFPEIKEYFNDKNIEALGIGCFGQIDLNRDSKTYGYITETPKIPWRNCDIVGEFKRSFNIPVGFDTDVNASLLGEATWGAARGIKNALYMTIGTGIGIGVLAEGSLVHGMLHPEAGHILLRQHPDDNFKGICPYHKNCFEGLACGPAVESRWGVKGADLAGNDSVWELEAYYIAQALYDYILVLSPEIIILGGGIMKQEKLFGLIHRKLEIFNGSYLLTGEFKNLNGYIVPAALKGDQGIMGAIKLAINEMGI
ncbi:hypothetical protein HMPREF9333_01191 [Johnsonella ignava ATCC 51276]|uniref:fructokinase n=1 Tax=Johnsonella ignava ATCC 51276 TaxID=679200 RepID=G5GI01_9FIRM|nr:ROK family protein [Johnsonella ignava]EHI55476.1 hypothetical protein HMPREF9333_01191 [Johnsonella ignava ATCC 51276]